jgi:hypothetical protein
MRSKVPFAAAIMAVALFSSLGFAATKTPDLRSRSDARQRRITWQLDRLTANLELNDQQKIRVKALITARIDDMRALRSEEDLTTEEIETKVRSIQTDYQSGLHEVLNAEQRQKLDEMRERNRQVP